MFIILQYTNIVVYLNQNKMETQKITPFQVIISSFEDRYFTEFKPKKSFYERSGINRIRFSKLLNAKAVPTVEEAEAIAKIFGVPITSFFTSN